MLSRRCASLKGLLLLGIYAEADFLQGNMFASGIAVDYGASVIVAKSGSTTDQGDGTDVSVSNKYRVVSDQSLAPEILIGSSLTLPP